jgi:hypothetical protein
MKIVKFTGGLGNQMFQYAFLMALENYFNEQILVDVSAFKNRKERKFELNTIFNIQLNIASPRDLRKVSYYLDNFNLNRVVKKIFKTKKTEFLEKASWAYDTSVFENVENRYYIGSWMNVFYFNKIEDKIRESFSFKIPNDARNQKLLLEIKDKNAISIHIRRGDYLQIKGHLICGLDYYEAAIDFITQKVENPYFYVFSDDVAWCRKNLSLLFGSSENYFIDWNTGVNSYVDMQLMAACRHNILANSTFSWWGAWLNYNSDKIVIASKDWAVQCKYEKGHVLSEWVIL